MTVQDRRYWMSTALGSLGKDLLCGEQSTNAFELNLAEAVT